MPRRHRKTLCWLGLPIWLETREKLVHHEENSKLKEKVTAINKSLISNCIRWVNLSDKEETKIPTPLALHNWACFSCVTLTLFSLFFLSTFPIFPLVQILLIASFHRSVAFHTRVFQTRKRSTLCVYTAFPDFLSFHWTTPPTASYEKYHDKNACPCLREQTTVWPDPGYITFHESVRHPSMKKAESLFFKYIAPRTFFS